VVTPTRIAMVAKIIEFTSSDILAQIAGHDARNTTVQVRNLQYLISATNTKNLEFQTYSYHLFTLFTYNSANYWF
jgi:hypothetical protein